MSQGPRSPVSEGWGQWGDPGEVASAGRDCRGEPGAPGGQLTMDSLDLGTQERSEWGDCLADGWERRQGA